MAPTNPGGRPKLDWTASRNRKLGRLYLLTDITIQDIQQVLKEDRFCPRSELALLRSIFLTHSSVRSIQAQLRLLLPNNVKEWRQYRPTEKKQMINRLTQLRRARQDRVSKHFSRRPRPRLESHTTDGATQSQPLNSHPTPYYNPGRYYNEEPSSNPLTLASFSFLDIKQYPPASSLQPSDATNTMPPRKANKADRQSNLFSNI